MIIERNLTKKESKVEARRRLAKEKHSVKEQRNCLKLCPQKISHNRRIEINTEFNAYDQLAQKLYIKSQTIRSTAVGNQRKQTRFFLNNDVNIRVNVYQKFFLTTLGFNPNNNTFLRHALTTEFPTGKRKDKEENMFVIIN